MKYDQCGNVLFIVAG